MIFNKLILGLALWLPTLAYAHTDAEIDRKVENLLAQMTLTEKIGQMTQITLNVVSVGNLPYDMKEPHELDEARLKNALVNYGVGSIFNVGDHAFSREHWREIIKKIQQVATTQTRLKIPVLYGIDAVHGTNYTYDSTLFPQQIGLAATWNPELVAKAAAITAYETRAIGVPWNFSPSVDVGRNRLHSRFYETFGEDTFLVKTLGKAMLQAYQGNDIADKNHIAATLKHFIAYVMPLNGIDRSSAWIPEHYLREYFLPPFVEAIGAGAKSVMLNLSEINGIPVHANPQLVTDLLQRELNFKGLIVSDWESIREVFYHHHVAENDKQAVKLAVLAGVDMSMVPYSFEFADHLQQLVKEGAISEQRINTSVRKILRLKFELGLFEHPYYPASDYPDFGSEKFRKVSQAAASESITLLKNEKNLLPLPKSAKILVTGFAADWMQALNGGWTYSWQGSKPLWVTHKPTILDALVQKFRDKVSYVETAYETTPLEIQAAVKAAADADYIVLCLGEKPYAENFGNVLDFALPETQIRLARELAATGKPVILVLTEGRPRVISAFAEQMQAIVMGYLPSNEGGLAIADILAGTVNPSGKLPFTYPFAQNSLTLYDHKHSETYAVQVQYPFGFGLSYTEFAYSNLKIDRKQLKAGDMLNISVNVTNTGKRAGKEVVQLYIGDVFASLAPPVKRLRGFEKIELQPQQTKTVRFKIAVEDIAFINAQNKKVAEKGDFEVMLGDLKGRFVLTEDVHF
jgi:beta-glucosidase